MLAIGLMSGTSLDGLDAVLCEISGVGLETKVKELAFETFPYPSQLKESVKKIAENNFVNIAEICSVNYELGDWFAQAVLSLCARNNIQTYELGFIASHGQTVYHIPNDRNNYVKSTLQLGESAVIAYQCKCPVISNFRAMDMAAKGEGAPLVPYSEYILHRSETNTIALQNIGGIGNVTIIPTKAELNDVQAFDTGPGNMMINDAMEILYGKTFDKNGEIAARGQLIKDLIDELKLHPFLTKEPPKSTGREEFGAQLTKNLLNKYQNNKSEDIITSLTWFTAYSIAYSYHVYILPRYDLKEVILAGGGVHNKTLVRFIRDLLPELSILTQEDKGLSSDSKEAVAFVILGNETLHRRPSNVPNATGAVNNVILGHITYPCDVI